MGFAEILPLALTVVLSIVGAWATINSRVYKVEKDIELLKLELKTRKELDDKRDKRDEKLDDTVTRIFDKLDELSNCFSEVKGKLQLKADKKFTN